MDGPMEIPMIVWLLVFVVMLLVVAGMAVGVMAGRKPIAGSCGGIANLGIEKSCGICGNDFTKCENKNQQHSGEKETLSAQSPSRASQMETNNGTISNDHIQTKELRRNQ